MFTSRTQTRPRDVPVVRGPGIAAWAHSQGRPLLAFCRGRPKTLAVGRPSNPRRLIWALVGLISPFSSATDRGIRIVAGGLNGAVAIPKDVGAGNEGADFACEGKPGGENRLMSGGFHVIQCGFYPLHLRRLRG
jgi:hypothetical protein